MVVPVQLGSERREIRGQTHVRSRGRSQSEYRNVNSETFSKSLELPVLRTEELMPMQVYVRIQGVRQTVRDAIAETGPRRARVQRDVRLVDHNDLELLRSSQRGQNVHPDTEK